MCAKLSKKSDPKEILVVSMTNIGDVVLTCPVIDILRQDFPQAKMDVLVGPKAVSLFEGNPNFGIKVFNKQAALRNKFELFLDLSRTHYDCVVDLRQTMLPFFLGARYSTPVLLGKVFAGHRKEKHLNRLRQVYEFSEPSFQKHAILTTKEDEVFFEREVSSFLQGQEFVLIAPGAADSAKRWDPQGFAALADHLSVSKRVVFVGDLKDIEIVNDIQRRMKSPTVSLAGKIHLRQLAFVLKKCSWAITHDSGVMHLASYFNVPLVVLWGPTDVDKYAPWSARSIVVRRNDACLRCLDPKSPLKHTCMSSIEVGDVIDAVGRIQP